MTQIYPSGISIVNHRTRTMLNISITEYCVLSFIIEKKLKHIEVTIPMLISELGINEDLILKVKSNLELKKMIKFDNQFFVNMEVVNKIKEIESNQYESEFEQFWTEKKDDKIIVSWPGPRKKTFDLFVIARKKFPFEFIMKQKKDYFELLKQQPYRQKMIATRFLNVNTGQIEEDWNFYNKDKQTEQSPDQQKITIDQKLNLFK